MDNSLSHQLFQKYTPTKMHQKRLDHLIACYLNGLEAVGIVRTKVKDYNNQKKSKNQPITISSQLSQKDTNKILNEQSTDYLSDITKSQFKQKKHRITKEY
ncbi:hypothetical protein RclHR1_35150002 [Rhizophagus clarus]|nr:hypothetical protein RclHR1_35150002 [Rhizophagus clarus]